MIDVALAFIHEQRAAEQKVLVHCNHGVSRSPGIAFLYLAKFTDAVSGSFEEAEAAFRTLYPSYSPMSGLREFGREHWSVYSRTSEM